MWAPQAAGLRGLCSRTDRDCCLTATIVSHSAPPIKKQVTSLSGIKISGRDENEIVRTADSKQRP